MADTTTVVYDGGHYAVDIHDPEDGSLIAKDVERGQSVDVPEHVAKDLLAREDFKQKDKPASAPQKDGK